MVKSKWIPPGISMKRTERWTPWPKCMSKENGAPEKSNRGIQGLTAMQIFHFTLRAPRVVETGQTWLDLCIPGISGCYCKRDWEESRPKMGRSKLTTAGDKLKMVRPQTTAREWTIQKEKSSQSWKIFGRQTGLGDSVDIRMGEVSQVSTPELLALQQHWK